MSMGSGAFEEVEDMVVDNDVLGEEEERNRHMDMFSPFLYERNGRC
jgi:hypothetical protein